MRSSASTAIRRQGFGKATRVLISACLFTAFLAVGAIISAQKLAVLAGGSHPSRHSAQPPHTTDLSEVIPLPCHSHNDFWRKVPLQSALQYGCLGVEADVWPYEGELFIGHSRGELTASRTLRSLYIEPLVQLLQQKTSKDQDSLLLGIYDTEPSETLVLLVDVKSDLTRAWPLLLDAVQPLHHQGWLSHLENGEFSMGPVTIVVTGDSAVRDTVNSTSSAKLGVFLDAPLHRISPGHTVPNGYYWASASLPKTVGRLWTGSPRLSQLNTIRQHVRKAHNQGLKVRYWGLPTWPPSSQKHTLEVLAQEGVDLFNADNLETAVSWIREKFHAKL